jgi:tRNA(Ile)-lysidine synthase TilS/MesJ
LAEREAISSGTDATYLVDRLKDRQQVEVKAAQIEHGALLDF